MRPFLLALQVAVAAVASSDSVRPPPQATPFAQLVGRLSEPGGYFDSDNLVSNETSYRHVLGALRALNLSGGAYIGVGPEQNFSYLAQVRPELAILVDIRRDNMLLHLLLKAMFGVARNRMEYLCLLFGRAVPPDLEMWTDLPLEQLLAWFETRPGDAIAHSQNHAMLMERVTGYGVPLDSTDRATLRRFHDEFMAAGTELRFTSRGRPPRLGYPTVAQLYLATDMDGRPGSYLVTEDAFRIVREMQRRDRVIPGVGDLSGPTAMKAIARYLKERNLQVSVFYVSNVEMYLFRQGTFPRFVENVRALPAGANSVLIRSYFGRGRFMGIEGDLAWPQVMPGHLSAQLVQPFTAFLEVTRQPETVTYAEVLSSGAIDLRTSRTPPARRRRRARLGVA